ncbi:MAG: hypothetical protein R6V40_02185 [Candidatus Moraniibacteriota bacterium]
MASLRPDKHRGRRESHSVVISDILSFELDRPHPRGDKSDHSNSPDKYRKFI